MLTTFLAERSYIPLETGLETYLLVQGTMSALQSSVQTTVSSCLERLGPGDIAGSADLPIGGHKKGIAELMSVSKTPADANVSQLTASEEEIGILEVAMQFCLMQGLRLPPLVGTPELTLADCCGLGRGWQGIACQQSRRFTSQSRRRKQLWPR